MSSALFFYFLF